MGDRILDISTHRPVTSKSSDSVGICASKRCATNNPTTKAGRQMRNPFRCYRLSLVSLSPTKNQSSALLSSFML